MAEVGFVTCERVARRVGEAALPAFRSTCSKRCFTQPQLLGDGCSRHPGRAMRRVENTGVDRVDVASTSGM